MNAISAQKPDQIKAMTMDTKQLIETQKSLMGMLQTFQPIAQKERTNLDHLIQQLVVACCSRFVL